MKVAILWTRLSGYLNVCLRALAEEGEASLLVSSRRPDGAAPFDESQFAWLREHLVYDDTPDLPRLAASLEAFAPDVVLITSWHIPAYRAVAKRLGRGAGRRPLRVLCMDNQWLGTPRQRLGALAAPFYVRPLYDAVWLPGETQAVFARRLGFRDREIWRGLYCGDQPRFAAAGADRRPGAAGRFLFTGRLAPVKGVAVLAAAYDSYRRAAQAAGETPWPLTVCGGGPLAATLAGRPGVEMAGFVQPEALPGMFAAADCLLLPSLYEPWGVVIHEAAAAGLAVICSAACGAGVHLVQDGYNGYLVESGSADDLARALLRYSRLSPDCRAAMAGHGADLARQFTPRRWAGYLRQRATEALEGGL